MQPSVYDLFGEVPVYTYDIDAWLRAVPRMNPDSPRAPQYVKGWDVVNKIKRFKAEGRFEEAIEVHEFPQTNWWRRFSWVTA